jgi:hypothetical protein
VALEEGDGDRFRDRHHLEGGDRLLGHLHAAQPRRDAAIADEPDRLVRPLLEEIGEGVDEWRRRAVVILGRDDDVSVAARDELAPPAGVLALILLKSRVVGLIHEREVDLGEIHLLDLEASMLARPIQKPLRHIRTAPPFADTRDDHLQSPHSASPD